MIASNSFALFAGKEATEELKRAVKRVDRFRRRILVDSGEGFVDIDSARSSDLAVAVFAIGEEAATLPLVHGFTCEQGSTVDGAIYPSGEFSILSRVEDGYVAGRDPLGTRPLYFEAGRHTRIASDHRYLDVTNPQQIPAGTVRSLSGRSIARRELARDLAEKTLDEASAELARLLDKSVEARVRGRKKVAVSFSGGLDSCTIALCAARHCDVSLCSVFAKGSRDEVEARRAADRLGLDLLSTSVDSHAAIRQLDMMDLPFDATPMDKALWCIFSMASKTSKEHDAELILLGQLADEEFGGYRKYTLAFLDKGEQAASAMMETDLRACSTRGFARDEAACAKWLEPRFPFADEAIVSFALGLPTAYKIDGEERKIVLRKAASVLGVPEALTQSPKKAAQYSSGLVKLVS